MIDNNHSPVTGLEGRRRLGSTGLRVSPIGLGTMQFGWTASGVQAFGILDAYTGAGGNLIDTANMYGGNQSIQSFEVNRAHVGVTESIVGRWLPGPHGPGRTGGLDEGPCPHVGRAGRRGAAPGPHHPGRRGQPAPAADGRRVEILYAHWPVPETDVPEEWLAAFGTLIQAGKVRFAGTSNFCDFVGMGDLLTPLLDLATERGLPRVRVEQPRYNLLNRAEYENRLQAIALGEDLGIDTYSSLAGGYLAAGNGDAQGPRSGQLARYDTPAGRALLDGLRQLSAVHGVPPAAIAVAWTLAQPGVSAALIGPERVVQLAEAAPAASLTLTAAELDSLTALSWAESDAEFVD